MDSYNYVYDPRGNPPTETKEGGLEYDDSTREIIRRNSDNSYEQDYNGSRLALRLQRNTEHVKK